MPDLPATSSHQVHVSIKEGNLQQKFGLNRLLHYMLSKAFHIKIPSMSFLFSVYYKGDHIIRAMVKFFIVQ
ncbi:hypothetical protein A3Q35_05955 [Aeribacillus pallidus]|nr:hypothetical protein A3Q35_05955 [Aeribacillus pallidus]